MLRSHKKTLVENLDTYEHEIIVCDNASTDKTLDILTELTRNDPQLKIIANSRNFGAPRSAFNGLMNAKGDAVIFAISADLQDPPSLIPEFVKKWEEGYKVVYRIRATRQERYHITLARKIFYRVVQKYSDFNIPPDVGDFQLLDKIVVDALHQVEDYYPYTRGLIAQCGFNSTGIKYDHLKREKGVAKGNLPLMIDLGLNGLISFTNMPLRLCMFLGLGISVLSLLYAFIQLFLTLIIGRGSSPPGIPTLIIALFFFSGVQLFFMGVLGEYISAIHSQIRKRPLVIEKQRINF